VGAIAGATFPTNFSNRSLSGKKVAIAWKGDFTGAQQRWIDEAAAA